MIPSEALAARIGGRPVEKIYVGDQLVRDFTEGADFTPASIDDLDVWGSVSLGSLTLSGSNVTAITGPVGTFTLVSGDGAIVSANEFASGEDGLDFTSDVYATGAFVTDAGTLFAICKADTTHAGIIIGRDAHTASNDGAHIRYRDNGDIELNVCDGISVFSATRAYTTNTTHVIIGRWTNGDLRLYVNGQLSSATPTFGTLGGEAIFLGARNSSGAIALDGKVAVWGKYSRFLTDQEVTDLAAYLEGLVT